MNKITQRNFYRKLNKLNLLRHSIKFLKNPYKNANILHILKKSHNFLKSQRNE
jgi:hypothetical protein